MERGLHRRQYTWYRGPSTASPCRLDDFLPGAQNRVFARPVQGRAPSDHPPNRSPREPREKAMNVAPAAEATSPESTPPRLTELRASPAARPKSARTDLHAA